MASSDKLAELYEHYNKLEAACKDSSAKGSTDVINECESSYLAILSAVHGSSPEKQLCSQFISKFFVHFPAHYETAIDALLDLCEDDDANIRRRAIKELPNLCRERKEFVNKIADVLAQLLLSEDPIELTIVNQALCTLANYDIKNFFLALFAQILEGEEETRDKVIKFLRDRFRLINPSLLTKEVEEFFLEEAKKVLVDVTKEEFVTLMTLLSGLKIAKTLQGHNTLLAIIKEQAELNTEFNPSDTDFLDKLLMCIRHGIPYFSQFSPSTEFVIYICTKILPNYSVLEASQTGVDLEVLQCLAEIVSFISPNVATETIEQCQESVFRQLLQFIPSPPEDLHSLTTTIAATSTEAASSATGGTAGETTTTTTSNNGDALPRTQFSHVECLLYAFHQLCKFNPVYFSDTVRPLVVKDFKLRLQYLARGVQSYINKLRKVISTQKPSELKSAESKIKVIALKATTNINTLIKDFFKMPPSYKSTIQLSFKTTTQTSSFNGLKTSSSLIRSTTTTPISTSISEKPETAATTVVGGDESVGNTDTTTTTTTTAKKRPLITAPEGSSSSSSSEVKRERKFYTPPGGKYSGGGGGFGGRGGYNGGGGRGNYRGGGNRNRFVYVAGGSKRGGGGGGGNWR